MDTLRTWIRGLKRSPGLLRNLPLHLAPLLWERNTLNSWNQFASQPLEACPPVRRVLPEFKYLQMQPLCANLVAKDTFADPSTSVLLATQVWSRASLCSGEAV